jgi:hypothetical protein
VQSNTTQTNAFIKINGTFIKQNNPGFNVTQINISAINVVDPNATSTGNQINGRQVKNRFFDVAGDGYFNDSDYVGFEINISSNEKRLRHIYFNIIP